MDFRFTDDQHLLRRSVREFAEAEIRPHVMEWDEAQQFPMELVSKLADLGLLGIQFPEEYGGAGMSAVDYCVCIEELARVCPAVALSVAAHNGLCSAHIGMFGSDEQKRAYLPRLVSGSVPRLGLTEAGATVTRRGCGRWPRGREDGWNAERRKTSSRTAGSAAYGGHRGTDRARRIAGFRPSSPSTDPGMTAERRKTSRYAR